MSTEKWIAGGGGLSWSADIKTSGVNSLASGNAVVASSQIDNSSNLDLYMDVELVLGSLNVGAPNFVGVYLYPLNSDASTYGDGRFNGTAAAGPPPAPYWVGNIGFPISNAAQQGVLRQILLPPAKSIIVLYNKMNVAFASSGNTLKTRFYDRSIA